MALPYSDLDFVTLSVGVLRDLNGNVLTGTLTLEPQFDRAVHLATGDVIVGTTITRDITPADAGKVSLTVLASDTHGLNLAGPFDWLVTLTVTPTSGGTRTKTLTDQRRVRLPRSAPTVDYDLLLPVTQPSNVVVSLPSVLSVAGLTGSVTVQDLINAGLGAPSVDLSGYPLTSSLATVAFTGSYNSLTDIPAVPYNPSMVGADPAGAAAAAVAALATVARTGSYADLTSKPAIPAAPGDIGAQPAGSYVTAADPRLSDARTPTGGASGALSGSFPSPGFNGAALDTAVAGRVNDTNSATYAAVRALATPPFTVTDNGDGTLTLSGSAVTDNGDGTVTLTY